MKGSSDNILLQQDNVMQLVLFVISDWFICPQSDVKNMQRGVRGIHLMDCNNLSTSPNGRLVHVVIANKAREIKSVRGARTMRKDRMEAQSTD